jgi:hypothetical protein
VKVSVIVRIWPSLAHFYSVNILFCLKVNLKASKVIKCNKCQCHQSSHDHHHCMRLSTFKTIYLPLSYNNHKKANTTSMSSS